MKHLDTEKLWKTIILICSSKKSCEDHTATFRFSLKIQPLTIITFNLSRYMTSLIPTPFNQPNLDSKQIDFLCFVDGDQHLLLHRFSFASIVFFTDITSDSSLSASVGVGVLFYVFLLGIRIFVYVFFFF